MRPKVRCRSRAAGRIGVLGAIVAVAVSGAATSARAAYRPACIKLLNIQLKSAGVVGQVKFWCPPTGASTWRFTLALTSMPDCDAAFLPTAQMGGPFAFSDPWPIERLIETSPVWKPNRSNNWVACLSVFEGLSQKPVGFECTNDVFIQTDAKPPAK